MESQFVTPPGLPVATFMRAGRPVSLATNMLLLNVEEQTVHTYKLNINPPPTVNRVWAKFRIFASYVKAVQGDLKDVVFDGEESIFSTKLLSAKYLGEREITVMREEPEGEKNVFIQTWLKTFPDASKVYTLSLKKEGMEYLGTPPSTSEPTTPWQVLLPPAHFHFLSTVLLHSSRMSSRHIDLDPKHDHAFRIVSPEAIHAERWRGVHDASRWKVVSAEGSGVWGVAVTRERVGMVEERVLVKDLLEEAVGEIKDVEKMVNVAGKVLKGLRVEALGIEGVTFVIDGVEPRAADDVEVDIVKEGKAEKTSLPAFLRMQSSPHLPVVKVRVDSSSRASLDLKDLHHLPVDGCTVLPYQLLNVPHNPIVALEAGDLLGYELATMINLEEDGEDEKEGEKERKEAEAWIKRVVGQGGKEWEDEFGRKVGSDRFMDVFGLKVTRYPITVTGRSIPILPPSTLYSLYYPLSRVKPVDRGTPRRATEVEQTRGGSGARAPLKWAVVNLDEAIGIGEAEEFCRQISRVAATRSLHLPLSPFPHLHSPYWSSAVHPGSLASSETLEADASLVTLTEDIKNRLRLDNPHAPHNRGGIDRTPAPGRAVRVEADARPKTSEWTRHHVTQVIEETHPDLLFVFVADDDEVSHDDVKKVAKRGTVKLPSQCIKGSRVTRLVENVRLRRLGNAVDWVKRMSDQCRIKVEAYLEAKGNEREVLLGSGDTKGEDVMVMSVVARVLETEEKGNLGSKPSTFLAVSVSMDSSMVTFSTTITHPELRSTRHSSPTLTGLRDAVHDILAERRRESTGQFPDRIIVLRWWDEGLKELTWRELVEAELGQMRHAFEKLDLGYRPRVSYVMMGKAEGLGFWPENKYGDGRGESDENKKSGTMVFGECAVDRKRFEFLLVPPHRPSKTQFQPVITSLEPMRRPRHGGLRLDLMLGKNTRDTGKSEVGSSLYAPGEGAEVVRYLVVSDENGLGTVEFIGGLMGLCVGDAGEEGRSKDEASEHGVWIPRPLALLREKGFDQIEKTEE